MLQRRKKTGGLDVMSRKPRSDSWKYLLRFLYQKNTEPMKELILWLETNKPLFWLSDAEGLAKRVTYRLGKIIRDKDIPDSVQPELVGGLVERLQAVRNWYEERKRKQAEYMKRINQAKKQIPAIDLQRLSQIVGKDVRCYSSENEEGYRELCKHRELAKTDTFDKINKWLSMSLEEREEWFKRTEKLFALQTKNHEMLRRQMEEETERKARKYREEQRRAQQRYDQANENLHQLYNRLLRQSPLSAYTTLGLMPGSSKQNIKSAYRDKAKVLHPDAGGDSKEFIKVQQAYEQLMAL
jgi:hypothetical protein